MGEDTEKQPRKVYIEDRLCYLLALAQLLHTHSWLRELVAVFVLFRALDTTSYITRIAVRRNRKGIQRDLREERRFPWVPRNQRFWLLFKDEVLWWPRGQLKRQVAGQYGETTWRKLDLTS